MTRLGCRVTVELRRDGRGRHPHALPCARALDPAHEQQLAPGKPGTDLAQVTTDGASVNVPSLQTAAPYDPHDGTAVLGADGGRRHHEPARRDAAGRRREGGDGLLEEFDLRPHLRKKP